MGWFEGVSVIVVTSLCRRFRTGEHLLPVKMPSSENSGHISGRRVRRKRLSCCTTASKDCAGPTGGGYVASEENLEIWPSRTTKWNPGHSRGSNRRNLPLPQPSIHSTLRFSFCFCEVMARLTAVISRRLRAGCSCQSCLNRAVHAARKSVTVMAAVVVTRRDGLSLPAGFGYSPNPEGQATGSLSGCGFCGLRLLLRCSFWLKCASDGLDRRGDKKPRPHLIEWEPRQLPCVDG